MVMNHTTRRAHVAISLTVVALAAIGAGCSSPPSGGHKPPPPWTAAVGHCWQTVDGTMSAYDIEYTGPVNHRWNAGNYGTGGSCSNYLSPATVVEEPDLLGAENECLSLGYFSTPLHISDAFTGSNIPADAWYCGFV